MARLQLTMTTGTRSPAVKWSISCMYAKPCEEVAVKTLAPAMDAPMQLDMAVCSDSTGRYLAFSSPRPMISARLSTITV